MTLHSGEVLGSMDLCSTRHFLIRQYRAQLKRRAQQVQEELVGLLHSLFIQYIFKCVIQLGFGFRTFLEFLCSHQEADRKILAALLEGQQDDRRIETVRRERAIADAAWMKRVIEEQLQLEQEREAEFDILHR